MAIGVGSLVPRVYNDFRGIDATKKNISLARTPDMSNMWINYKDTAGKCVETRPGFEQFASKIGGVYGIHYYVKNSTKTILLHVGVNIYVCNWDPIERRYNVGNTPLYTNMSTTASTSVMYDDILLIKDGTNYLKYNGSTISEIAAYVPRTRIGCLPASGDSANATLRVTGSSWEAVNMLSDYRINSFVRDGVGTKYKLNETSIDTGFTPYVEINGEAVTSTNYSVDYTNAVITFNEPPAQTLTDGEDNVFIKYKKAVTGYKTKITNCQKMTAFNNTIFFWGNPDYPNTMWFAESTQVASYETNTMYTSNLTIGYVPDINYVKDGYDYGKITAVVPSNNALWVFKDEASETTVFYHVPQFTYKNGEGSLGHYDYASVYSSIARGCVATGTNFGDDIVYLSNRGLEGIVGDITTEQSTAHRSTLIDALILNEKNYKKAVIEEYEGYLLVCIDKTIYLADSKGKFTNEDHLEYEWFKWDLAELTGNTEKITSVKVVSDVLYIGTSAGIVYSLTNTSDDRTINSHWTTPEDEFMVGQYQKTTSKRGCVINMQGSKVQVDAKIDNGTFETINTYTNTGENPKDYVVCRIKRKKWKAIQLKFSSNKPFGLYSCTLQAYVGGYVKR